MQINIDDHCFLPTLEKRKLLIKVNDVCCNLLNSLSVALSPEHCGWKSLKMVHKYSVSLFITFYVQLDTTVYEMLHKQE